MKKAPFIIFLIAICFGESTLELNDKFIYTLNHQEETNSQALYGLYEWTFDYFNIYAWVMGEGKQSKFVNTRYEDGLLYINNEEGMTSFVILFFDKSVNIDSIDIYKWLDEYGEIEEYTIYEFNYNKVYRIE